MFHIVLYQPEIPPNTGNIMRLCANAGASLHLIHPLGYTLDDRHLRRAGLDYRDLAVVQEHPSLQSCLAYIQQPRTWACTTRGQCCYASAVFSPGDAFLFGPETRGLPASIIDIHPQKQTIKIPMMPGNRSLNLANSVAVILFEAWRQQGFKGSS